MSEAESIAKEGETSKPETKVEDTKSEVVVEDTTPTTSSAVEPPSKPKRPLSPTAKAIKELQDAFPTIEEKYIKMALIASQGSLDPAFNALLYLSDPTSDITIPVPDVKPKLPSRESIEKRNQLESDEALARRLAREFEKTNKASATSTRRQGPPPKPTRKPIWNRDDEFNETPYRERYGEEDDEPDFIDAVSKGVDEAKVKVSGWLGNIAKKINDTTQQAQSSNNGPNQLFSAFGGGNRNSSEEQQHSRQSYSSRPSYSSSSRRQSQRQQSYTSEDGKILLDDNESRKRNSELPPRPTEVSPSTTTTTTAATTAAATTATAASPAATASEASVVPVTSSEDKSKDETLKKSEEKADGDAKGTGKSDSKWTSLASVDPQPVGDDTFLVDDSDEDEEEEEK